ncbi:MAG: MarR family transcriptional regulator [Microbacterium sp.]|uniref:MarR family transcriptional regulator n=2 Tax=Microbacterium ginsengisoli TaxID=400772 RepID=A0A3C1KGI0_9MICO|nr:MULTISPECIES: MarR family winged helix-turn-helix transcriptional regulator [unclassified Microbacterium]MAL05326.1 MarR family transcriptional regulator [Microbacterium sp.]MBN9199134.1 winged helix-turn-helix transcriptional regulator [Microbacterium ginsengisoli]MCK9914854.1 MarR family winged helix-turn-helix transcriptional regulator [Microbacteriaceae bacterium K1510]MBN9207576.1 winged helix-turn-helix transcriptional regulator [Microbacterium ginsengisoli]HAN25484.1 MarR family tran
MTADDPATDPVDAIAAALGQLRGRRGPRPPWVTGHDGPHPHGGRGRHGFGPGAHGGGPWAAGAPGAWGGPPWAGGGSGRFAGPARLRLLDAVVAASEPLTVSEIAEAVGVDQPRASRLVQQCVDLGLVRREADPDDARRTRIVVTEQGRTLARGFRIDRREAVETALAAFTDDERAELARLLAKLAAAWPA